MSIVHILDTQENGITYGVHVRLILPANTLDQHLDREKLELILGRYSMDTNQQLVDSRPNVN